MKHIFKSISFLLLIFSNTQLNAQTNEIDFTTTSESVNVSGQNITLSSTINKSENNLTWTLFTNENTNVNDFTITSTEGNWNQNTSVGSLTYYLVKDEQQASLNLAGQQGSLTATLTFTINESEQGSYIFIIDTISYQ